MASEQCCQSTLRLGALLKGTFFADGKNNKKCIPSISSPRGEKRLYIQGGKQNSR